MPATAKASARRTDSPAGRLGARAVPPPAPPFETGGRERPDLLPLVGIAGLFLLVVVALHLSSSLRQGLEDELAGRLRISARLATRSLSDGEGVASADEALQGRLDEIRASTAVTDLVFYDLDGALVGGSGGPAVPRKIRLAKPGRAEPADPASRVPEWDPAGGLSLVVPVGTSGVGAFLARIGREGQGSLGAAQFFFQVAKGLAAVVIVSGFLIVLRWLVQGGPTAVRPVAVAVGSDVDLVLGTMKEVMSTLKDSESQYRDRAAAAEADVQRHRVTHEQVLSSVPSGIVAFDVSARITQINRSAEALLATERRHAIGRVVGAVFGPDDRLTEIATDALERGRTAGWVEILRPGDESEPRWIGASSSLIRAADGTLLGGILLVTDLTETKQLREQMALKDRLSAVGEMSAGIAHEIKNSLHSLNGLANLLRQDVGDGEPPLAVGGILSEVRSLESLVQGILEFSKPSQLLRRPVLVGDLLRETEGTTASLAEAAGVEIRLDLEDRDPILADGDALKRVFVNVALNAIEAMKDGGTLTISTRTTELREDDGRPALRIVFRDTGPGIPEADRARVFTPFYSTKRGGNGLGLALAHRTVTDHGGRLSLHSRVGVGTEFVIHLPAGEVA